MIDRQLPRAWPPDALERRIVAALRLRTFASRRPRSRRYSQYRRFLRPCAARFATAQDITELGINHLEAAGGSRRAAAAAGVRAAGVERACLREEPGGRGRRRVDRRARDRRILRA